MSDPSVPNSILTVSDSSLPIMVSVVVPTYQHAAYIEECLDGILMQRTTFPIEILIGEDESTDGTREICQRYAAEHPDRIRLFLRSRKDVIEISGRPTGRSNFKGLLGSVRGRYVAMCEGDDYWIDPLKLQKQVDLLERDASVSLVFHNVWVKHEESRLDYFLDHGLAQVRFTATEILSREWFVGTASICARAEPLIDVLADFDFAISGDSVLQYHAALKGDFHYLDEVGSVYRRHAGGISAAFWSSAGGASDAHRRFFEVVRPNHVWTLQRIAMKVEDNEGRLAIAGRVEELLRMIALHSARMTAPNRLVTMEELEAETRELLVAGAPKDAPVPDLGPGSGIGDMIERVVVSVWGEQAEENLRSVARSGKLSACLGLCVRMYRERTYSRKVLMHLAWRSIGWWMYRPKSNVPTK